MLPMQLFLFLRSLFRLGFSKDPDMVKGRKELEDWYKHGIREPFLEGYEGRSHNTIIFDHWTIVKIMIVFGGLIALMVWLSSRPL